MLAVSRDSVDAVSLLLEHKAEVNDSGDVSNLHLCKLKMLVCISLVSSFYSQGLTPLLEASIKGSIEIVSLLLQYKADVNIRLKV